MICKNCGANNPDGVIVCRSCSERITVSAETRKNQLDQIHKQHEINKQLEKQKAEELRQRLAKEEAEKKQIALSKMLISSGFSFDGYTIVKYSGYISGDDAVQIPRSTDIFLRDDNGKNLTDALVKIRRQALIELKEAAYDLGCNAVIGVDFDYITLAPETQALSLNGSTVLEPYVICVTANGNAVVVEKNHANADI